MSTALTCAVSGGKVSFCPDSVVMQNYCEVDANFATAEFGFAGFFTAPPVCSAAVGIKSERFQNSSSNKSRRGVRGGTSVERLLLGYNVLRDDSVTRAGQLWTVWRVLRDSSANCEDLLRRIRPFLRLNQA